MMSPILDHKLSGHANTSKHTSIYSNIYNLRVTVASHPHLQPLHFPRQPTSVLFGQHPSETRIAMSHSPQPPPAPVPPTEAPDLSNAHLTSGRTGSQAAVGGTSIASPPGQVGASIASETHRAGRPRNASGIALGSGDRRRHGLAPITVDNRRNAFDEWRVSRARQEGRPPPAAARSRDISINAGESLSLIPVSISSRIGEKGSKDGLNWQSWLYRQSGKGRVQVGAGLIR